MSEVWEIKAELLHPHLDKLEQELVGKKPSELLRLAVADVKQVHEHNRVDGTVAYVDMLSWIRIPMDGLNPGRCMVCLAGAVIGNRLPLADIARDLRLHKIRYEAELSPSDFPSTIMNIMNALNDMREGRVRKALIRLGYSVPSALEDALDDWQLVGFSESPKRFFEGLEQLAVILERHNL